MPVPRSKSTIAEATRAAIPLVPVRARPSSSAATSTDVYSLDVGVCVVAVGPLCEDSEVLWEGVALGEEDVAEDVESSDELVDEGSTGSSLILMTTLAEALVSDVSVAVIVASPASMSSGTLHWVENDPDPSVSTDSKLSTCWSAASVMVPVTVESGVYPVPETSIVSPGFTSVRSASIEGFRSTGVSATPHSKLEASSGSPPT